MRQLPKSMLFNCLSLFFNVLCYCNEKDTCNPSNRQGSQLCSAKDSCGTNLGL